MVYMRIDRSPIGEDGCCLICTESGDCNNPCYQCKCTKCDWYRKNMSRKTNHKCYFKHFMNDSLEIEIDEVAHSTEKAYLLYSKRHNSEEWFPSSKIDLNTEDGLKADIPYWLLEKKGWVPKKGWPELGFKLIDEVQRKLRGKNFTPRRRN